MRSINGGAGGGDAMDIVSEGDMESGMGLHRGPKADNHIRQFTAAISAIVPLISVCHSLRLILPLSLFEPLFQIDGPVVASKLEHMALGTSPGYEATVSPLPRWRLHAPHLHVLEIPFSVLAQLPRAHFPALAALHVKVPIPPKWDRDYAMDTLCTFLSSLPSLRELHFLHDGWSMDEEDDDDDTEAREDKGQGVVLSNLKELNLSGETSMRSLRLFLDAFDMPVLEQLIVICESMPDLDPYVWPSVKSLTVWSQCGCIMSEGISALTQACPNVEHLEVSVDEDDHDGEHWIGRLITGDGDYDPEHDAHRMAPRLRTLEAFDGNIPVEALLKLIRTRTAPRGCNSTDDPAERSECKGRLERVTVHDPLEYDGWEHYQEVLDLAHTRQRGFTFDLQDG